MVKQMIEKTVFDNICGKTKFLFDDNNHLHIVQVDHKGYEFEVILTDKELINELPHLFK